MGLENAAVNLILSIPLGHTAHRPQAAVEEAGKESLPALLVKD